MPFERATLKIVNNGMFGIFFSANGTKLKAK